MFAAAAPASRRSTIAAAGTWGVLRNMLQEFPGFKWAGADRGVVAACGEAAVPPDTDAFGCAADGGPTQGGICSTLLQLCNANLT